MTLKHKIYLAIIYTLAFIGQLIFLGYLAATAVQAAEPKTTPSALGLWRHSLNIVSLSPVIAQGGRVGAWLFTTTHPPRGRRIMSNCTTVTASWQPLAGLTRSESSVWR
jgi:hypothetical protein